MNIIRIALPIVASVVLAVPALAQEPYPTKPVTIIVLFSPDGGTDTGTRWVAQKLSERWGQSVVDNKPGAAGMIGADFVARAKPDGYTIMMANAQAEEHRQRYKKLIAEKNITATD